MDRREVVEHVECLGSFWGDMVREAEREVDDLKREVDDLKVAADEFASALETSRAEVSSLKARLHEEERRRASYQEVHGAAVGLVRSASLAASSPVGEEVRVDAPRSSWDRLASLIDEPYDEPPVAPGVSAARVWEVYKAARAWSDSRTDEACSEALNKLEALLNEGAASDAQEGAVVGIALDGTPVRLRATP
jgi:regulator of replication initiation timing